MWLRGWKLIRLDMSLKIFQKLTLDKANGYTWVDVFSSRLVKYTSPAILTAFFFGIKFFLFLFYLWHTKFFQLPLDPTLCSIPLDSKLFKRVVYSVSPVTFFALFYKPVQVRPLPHCSTETTPGTIIAACILLSTTGNLQPLLRSMSEPCFFHLHYSKAHSLLFLLHFTRASASVLSPLPDFLMMKGSRAQSRAHIFPQGFQSVS